MPEVSVIIPSFNCAEYIGGAIESVLRQTLQDFEIIVVDDGSADDTQQVVRPYLSDSRVHYIRQANRGLPGARNTGAQAARATYLAFLDADDALDPSALQKMCRAVSGTSACWCVIDVLKVHGAKTLLRETQIPEGNLFHGILRDDFICRGMFLRRDDFMSIGMYDPEMKNREDWDLNIRMLEHGKEFVYVSEPLYLYSWREGSITRNSAKMLRYTEQVLRKHHKRLADAGDPVAAELYAENLWELARNHFYGLRNIRKSLQCVGESLRYDMSLRRLFHPVIHQFQRLLTN